MKFRFSPKIFGVFAKSDDLQDALGTDSSKNKNISIDTDNDGNPLYKQDIITWINDELEQRKNDRKPLENQWILNTNFLAGNQFCDVNTHTGEIEQYDPVYGWLEHETFNQIAPLIDTRIANLKKLDYLMTVRPRTNELDDYQKSDISTQILRYTQSNTDFDDKKNTALLWNEVTGNCFFLSWWDSNAGDVIETVETIEIDDNGVEKRNEKSYCSGDLKWGLITPYELYPESLFKSGVDAQRSIIIEQVMSVDDIYDMYNIKVKGEEVETFDVSPMPSGGGYGYEASVMTIGHRTTKNANTVVTYFEKPTPHRIHGRMIIICDDNLIYYGDLPYSRIPIAQIKCREVAGQFFGKSVIESLIPLQRAYNSCLNRIHEYIDRIAIQSYFVPDGSVDLDKFQEIGIAPGDLVPYTPGIDPPSPIPNAVLPGEVLQERYNLKSDMEYVAGTSQLMVNGATPSGVTSGTAIQNLVNIDNTRLAMTGDNIRNGVINLAKIWLEIYKKYGNTYRIINSGVGTNNIGNAIEWCGDDINSFDIVFDVDNELTIDEDTRSQQFIDAFKAGLFTDQNGVIPERYKKKFLECMKIGNYTELMSIHELQMQAAQRENSFFERGVIPKVSEFDDHDIHIEEHKRYMYQLRYQMFAQKNEEYALAFENHIRQHMELANAAANPLAMLTQQQQN